MKIYKHTGPGHYIGSCVIVVAKSEESATKLIRGILDNMGLSDEVLNIETFKIKDCAVIEECNGDY